MRTHKINILKEEVKILSLLRALLSGKTDLKNVKDAKLTDAGVKLKKAINFFEATMEQEAAAAGMTVDEYIESRLGFKI